jgi:excinuclease ABC subunit C
MADAFRQHAARRIEISKPQRGEKRDLVAHATTNAREALARKLADSASQTKLLEGLAEALNLDATPRRIEVYDNSHIMGTNAVGGMIVAGPDGFVKNQYRKFNIKDSTLTPGDDFGMMREVLTRRFSRLVKENGDGPQARAAAPFRHCQGRLARRDRRPGQGRGDLRGGGGTDLQSLPRGQALNTRQI